MRTTTAVLAIILSILSIYAAYFYYQRYDVLKQELNQERYGRYVSEEALEEKNSKIVDLEAELVRAKKKAISAEKKYNETKALNSTLKIRLDTASRENKSLKIRAEELEAIILKNNSQNVAE